jgi:GGDEF domain-containing protein
LFCGGFLFASAVFLELMIKGDRKGGLYLPFHTLIASFIIAGIIYFVSPDLFIGLINSDQMIVWLLLLLGASWICSEFFILLLAQVVVFFARFEILGKAENRYQMEEWLIQQNLDKKLNEVKRYGGKLSLILFGINFGKTAPHGNQLIDFIFQDVKKIIRKIDIAGRIDKGKFIALINHTDSKESSATAKRIAAFFIHDKKISSEYHLREENILIGIDTASNKESTTAEKMIEEAKKQLTPAKKLK